MEGAQETANEVLAMWADEQTRPLLVQRAAELAGNGDIVQIARLVSTLVCCVEVHVATLTKFLGDVLGGLLPEAANTLSTVLADCIWELEQRLDAAKAQHADQEGEQRARARLVELAKALLSGDGPVLDAEHCRRSWEYPLLHETGIITFSLDATLKQSARVNTANNYKQQRFNLLREESEGYAHLVTELISEMGPASTAELIAGSEGDETSYPSLRAAVVTGESDAKLARRAARVADNVKALIGFFDLDPNRTLDVILDVFSYNVATHHRFFLALLRQTHWLDDANGPSTSYPVDGTLENRTGSHALTAILGFKFAFYQRPDADPTPEELYLMAAVLVWDGAIALPDLLPYLSPDAGSIGAAEDAWRADVAKKGEASGPRNALSMAGALEGAPARSSAKEAASAVRAKDLPNQRAGLLTALLSIGALSESIFILSLPGHAFLARSDPANSALLVRLLNVVLQPAVEAAGVEKDVAEPDEVELLTAAKKKYHSAGAGKHELVAADIPKPVLSRTLARLRTTATPGPAPEQVFFWSEWRTRLPLARTPAEVLDLVVPCLRFLGPNGHLDLGFFHRLSELTALHVAPAATTAEGKRPASDPRWLEVVRSFLLPSLSMMDACVSASNDVWQCLAPLPYEDRFRIYGEWKSAARQPELGVAIKKADHAAKGVLKTMTTDNAKEKARALARLAVTNPLVTFNVALTQIQTYSNLIPCVVDSLRYLNSLSFDVLSFSIVDFLSNPDKDRSKSDGTNLAMWLQNLANFVGAVFKRMLNLDPALVLQYIANQLHAGNAKDLVILRELICQMADVDVLRDLSSAQVMALGGSKSLRAEALNPTTVVAKKRAHGNPARKLMEALQQSELTAPLFLLIALQRQNAVMLEAPGAHLKYLGVLADNCQQVLFQYIDFLRSHLATDEYRNLLPSVEDLCVRFALDPSIAFQLWRPALAADIRAKVSFKGSELVVEAEPAAPDDDAEDGMVAERSKWPEALADAVQAMDVVLPTDTKRILSPHFFATFWQLDLYDLRMPEERYTAESARLLNLANELDRELQSASTTSAMRESARSQRSRVGDIRSSLLREMKVHVKQYEITRRRLQAERDAWFPSTCRNNVARKLLIDLLLQHCIHPRAKLTPTDAAYAAQFVKTLHGLGAADFATLKFFDRIFGPDLGAIIFPCTESEAANYGRFLHDMLALVKTWYDNKDDFVKTGLGLDKAGTCLPGLRLKPSHNEGRPAESEMINHDNLRTVARKWTGTITTVFIGALESGEYMHIRNSIAVLKELDQLAPLIEADGVKLEAAVARLVAREAREDVKVLASGYHAMLKRAAPKWIKPDAKVKPTTESKPIPTKPAGLPDRPGLARQASKANGVVDPPAAPKSISTEASQREAQARAAVQASQARRQMQPPTEPSKDTPTGPRASRLPTGPKADRESSLPTGPSGHRSLPVMPPPTSPDKRSDEAKRPREESPARDVRDSKRPREDEQREDDGRRGRDEAKTPARSRNPSKESTRSTRERRSERDDKERRRRSRSRDRDGERRKERRHRSEKDRDRHERDKDRDRKKDRDREKRHRERDREREKEKGKEREGREGREAKDRNGNDRDGKEGKERDVRDGKERDVRDGKERDVRDGKERADGKERDGKIDQDTRKETRADPGGMAGWDEPRQNGAPSGPRAMRVDTPEAGKTFTIRGRGAAQAALAQAEDHNAKSHPREPREREPHRAASRGDLRGDGPSREPSRGDFRGEPPRPDDRWGRPLNTLLSRMDETGPDANDRKRRRSPPPLPDMARRDSRDGRHRTANAGHTPRR